MIDGIECVISSASTTEIQCTTGPRPGLKSTSLEITVQNMGLVSN